MVHVDIRVLKLKDAPVLEKKFRALKPFDQRTVCEQLGQILALRIATREDADEMAFRLERRRILVQLLGGLTKGADFLIDHLGPK